MNYRKIAFERFKEGEEPYCERCRITLSEARDKYKNGLDVHHLDCLPKSHEDYHKNNDPENLKVLCMGCHISVHSSGENHYLYGKTHSEKTLSKMSETARGKIRSDEHCKNISKSKLGVPRSEDTKRKVSESLKGKPVIKLYTNYIVNVWSYKSEKPEDFTLIQNLTIEADERTRLKSLPTYTIDEYNKLISQS